jgi:hypothetical protein
MDTVVLGLAIAALTFLATFAGPIAAVQVQKRLEKNREAEARKMDVFRVLMATRATRLAPEHVGALNVTPIVFYGVTTVMDAWRIYVQHLGAEQNDNWSIQGNTYFSDLLQKMASHLGFSFDIKHLNMEVYNPTGHIRMEQDKQIILAGLVDLFTGKYPLQMDVRGFPVDPDIRAQDIEIRRLLMDWLKAQLPPPKSALGLGSVHADD